MHIYTRRLVIASALALSLAGATALAQPVLHIDEPWVRATVPGQPVAGAYMKLSADVPLRLVTYAPSTRPAAGLDSILSPSRFAVSTRLSRASIAATRVGHSPAGTLAITRRTSDPAGIVGLFLPTCARSV